MPSGSSNDPPQQPRSSGILAADNKFLIDRSIWNPNGANTYQPAHNRLPSHNNTFTQNGANGVHPKPTSWKDYTWHNPDIRPTSTSPTRTRDTTLPRPSTYGTGTEPSYHSNGSNGLTNGLQDGPVPRQSRPSHDASHVNTTISFPSRDSNGPASGLSQPSPGLNGSYNGRGHGNHSRTQSHSSQPLNPRKSLSISHQMSNTRAFAMNNQIAEHMNQPVSRRGTVDYTASGSTPAEQPIQPPHSNPVSQPFSDANGSNVFSSEHGGAVESLIRGLSTWSAPSADSSSPAPSYHTEVGSNLSAYPQAPSNIRDSQPSPAHPTTTDVDGPGSSQGFASHYALPNVPQQNPYANMSAQSLAVQQFAAQNIAFQNIAAAPNMPPQNMPPQNMPPQHMAYQHMVSQFAPSQFAPALAATYSQSPHQPVFNLTPHAAGYSHGASIHLGGQAADTTSRLLREFKMDKNHMRWPLDKVLVEDELPEFCVDDKGSRFLQAKLEHAKSDELEEMFKLINDNIIPIMKGKSGNFVAQKFFLQASQTHKNWIRHKIIGTMVDLSLHRYGCRVVQYVSSLPSTMGHIYNLAAGLLTFHTKVIEHSLVNEQLEMARALEPELPRVIRSEYGNFVVQLFITLLDRKHLDFVMGALHGCVLRFSMDQYGCRVVQKMMEHGTEEDRETIIGELRPHLKPLIRDEYGNYVAQYILVQGKFEDRLRLASLVLDNLHEFCKQKYASNVVEKCITNGVPELRTMIRQRLEDESKGTSLLDQLIQDGYGNYSIREYPTHPRA
ncbi:mRNA-binding protein-like protein [Hapsidospora chrysogenum ATCC 11550]|uniref:mRNA-binding protein-like protein n=1 Tax=Hapsidospora chrysogenum (strain ATCC 11550 / CBS 779.69 / DSM 880 / IAM 14645 / JCM 23072 / IMI 49137) TaxID=857340 RepID=A0A086TIB1_HAPC1|nr:mRNA-binding protein-like protein [Hapsidospora chrysogenum ATCC 11550]